MNWDSYLDPQSLDIARSLRSPRTAVPQNFDPQIADRLDTIRRRAPWLTPETSLALAKGYASDAAVDAVGTMAGRRTIDNQGAQQQEVLATGMVGLGQVLKFTANAFNFGKKYLGKAINIIPGALSGLTTVGDSLYAGVQYLKGPSKYVTAALDLVPELANTALAKVLQPITHMTTEDTPGGFWDATSIGQLLMNPEESGDGFFISADMRQKQAIEARAYRGVLNGSAFTLGRGVASLITKPGGQGYANVSGVVDAIFNIKMFDPTKLIRKPVESIRLIHGVVPLVSDAARPKMIETVGLGTRFAHKVPGVDALDKHLNDIRRLTGGTDAKALMRAEAGLTQSLAGGGVDMEKFVHFMKTNTTAKKLTTMLVDEKNSHKIMQDIFNGEMTTDLAYDLSQAKSADEVIATLTRGYSYGKETLSRRIGDYPNTPFAFQKYPGINGLFKTRLFSEVPDHLVVVNGTSLDNMKAIKNMTNSLRAAGVGSAEIEEWGHGAVKSWRTYGTSSDIHDQIKSYNHLIEKQLITNGVPKEVAAEILKGDRQSIDRMRSYFQGRNGVETDGGLLQNLLDDTKGFLGPQAETQMLDSMAKAAGGHGYDLTFNSPMQYADMLNRVHVLPDVRVLRRLTRNSLFTDFLKKLPGAELETLGAETFTKSRFAKRAVMSKKRVKEIAVITDKPLHAKLTTQIEKLEEAHNPTLRSQQTLDQLRNLKNRRDALVVNESKRVLTGEQRTTLSAMEFIQNGLWKPFTLMTGGYTMRNMIDAQVRMAFGNMDSGITHPFEWLSLVTGKQMRKFAVGQKADTLTKDILGGDIKAGGKITNPYAAINEENLLAELREGLTNGGRVRGMGTADFQSHMYKTGSFADVSRGMPGNGLSLHTEGIVQQGGKIYNDAAQRAGVRSLFLDGNDEDVAVKNIVAAIRGDQEVYKQVEGMFQRGIEFLDPTTGSNARFPSMNFKELDAKYKNHQATDKILEAYARRTVLANADMITGRIPEMQFMAAFNHTPVLNPVTHEMIREVTDLKGIKTLKGASIDVLEIEKEAKRGATILLADGRKGIIINVDSGGATAKFTVVPVSESDSFTRFGTRSAKNIIARNPLYDDVTKRGLPEKVSREVSGSTPADQGHLDKLQKAMDRGTNWFFNVLNEREIRELERSPVFRQYYYKHVGEHIKKLSSEEAQKFLQRIGVAAAGENQTMAKYIGSASTIKRIEKIAASTSHKGTLTLEELDDFAKFRGLHETQNLLFDASNTNNLKDILRVVVPFGNAWNEVIARYLSFAMTDNIHMYRSFSRVYTGLAHSDPDGDGRGWFYTDPQTNKMMFMFPGSGLLSKIITGGDYQTPMAAPVQRLSQGINVYPGIGPMMQWTASKFIPDEPKYDNYIDMLLPYGRNRNISSAINPTPGWARKLYEAFQGNTADLSTTYANTYLETIKAEANTGNYDLSLPEEIERIKAVSKGKAQWLTGLRVISQFIGPTSATPEFKIPTGQGDMYVREMSKELNRLRVEDYDSSIEKFLKLYGEDAALYVAGKSRAIAKGLETSSEFGDWARLNDKLVERYPTVANYLAPTDDGFDFQTHDRQLRAGDRELLSDKEMIDEAQLRIGSARYRAARVLFGPYPNETQRKQLSNYRLELNRQYPGFPPKAEFTTNEFTNQIFELTKLVNDPLAQSSAATDAIKKYLELRSSAIASSGSPTLASKKSTRLRGDLFAAGEALALSDPAFARIWKRLLLKEVED